MCSILLEYGFSPSIPRPLQNILSNQPELPKGISHDNLTKRQLSEVGLLNPLLQIVAGIGFIRNVPPRLRNRQRFGSTKKSLLEPLSKSKALGEDFFHYFLKSGRWGVRVNQHGRFYRNVPGSFSFFGKRGLLLFA